MSALGGGGIPGTVSALLLHNRGRAWCCPKQRVGLAQSRNGGSAWAAQAVDKRLGKKVAADPPAVCGTLAKTPGAWLKQAESATHTDIAATSTPVPGTPSRRD